MTKTQKKNVILLLKVAIFVLVLVCMGIFVWRAWHKWQEEMKTAQQADIGLSLGSLHWEYGIVAVLGFCGVMLTSGLTWRWLARQMGDRSPAQRMVGAYIFSQIGKYIPGKVALLLMRIERASRFGMTVQVCTLSTLVENALYMVSGALVGMFAVPRIAGALPAEYHTIKAAMWPATIGAAVVLLAACHPAVFYRLVNSLLKNRELAPVPKKEQLRPMTLVLGVLAFLPCWACGGLALWGTTCCFQWVPLTDCGWFMGAFSLSVIIGMISFLPGGTGIREVVVGVTVTAQLSGSMSASQAVVLGTLAAILQRIFQLAAEVILWAVGAFLTRKKAPGFKGGVEAVVA